MIRCYPESQEDGDGTSGTANGWHDLMLLMMWWQEKRRERRRRVSVVVSGNQLIVKRRQSVSNEAQVDVVDVVSVLSYYFFLSIYVMRSIVRVWVLVRHPGLFALQDNRCRIVNWKLYRKSLLCECERPYYYYYYTSAVSYIFQLRLDLTSVYRYPIQLDVYLYMWKHTWNENRAVCA